MLKYTPNYNIFAPYKSEYMSDIVNRSVYLANKHDESYLTRVVNLISDMVELMDEKTLASVSREELWYIPSRKGFSESMISFFVLNHEVAPFK